MDDWEREEREQLGRIFNRIEQDHQERIAPFIRHLVKLDMFGSIAFKLNADGSVGEMLPREYPPDIQKQREQIEEFIRTSAETRNSDQQAFDRRYPSFFARSSALTL